VSNDEGLGFPIKTQEAGEIPATFSFRFTEDALYVTGTAPIGEDQALIMADVLGECFGAQMLEAAAAFAVEQEAGKPRSTSSGSWSRCVMTLSPTAKTQRSPRTGRRAVRLAAGQPAGPEIGKAFPRPLSGAAAARRSRQEQAGEDLLLYLRTRTVSSGTSWYPAK
jgi:hypothetical protein